MTDQNTPHHQAQPSPSLNDKRSALGRLLQRLPAQLAFYGSALGAIALTGGASLPPILAPLAGGIGVNILSNMIERVARGEQLSDPDIERQIEIAIRHSKIEDLLTQEQFNVAMQQVVKQVDLLRNELLIALEELRLNQHVQQITLGNVKGGLVNIGGSMTVEGSVFVGGSHFHEDTEQQRRIRRYLIGLGILSLGTMASLVILILLVRPDLLVEMGILSPEPMPPGFNVVVAGLGVAQDDGTIKKSDKGDWVNAIVSSAINEFDFVDHVRDVNDPGVDYILGSTPQKRQTQADKIAKEHGADIVIYGYFYDLDGQVDFVPEFYIAPGFAALQPELIGADVFGNPVTIIEDADRTDALSTRLATLRLFLRGLVEFIVAQDDADYQSSQAYFQDAINLNDTTEGLEVLYILAGNAASRRNDSRTAFQLYSAALNTRSQYARGLLGRGAGFFQIAGEINRGQPPIFDPSLHLPAGTTCTDDVVLERIELLIEIAEICYREAIASPDQPPAADIDVKGPYQLGLLFSWRSCNGYGNKWNEVNTTMSEVITLYDNAPADKQSRIIVHATRAHETLGKQLQVTACTDPTQVTLAIEHYRQAMELIKRYPNRAYREQRLDYEQSQIDQLQTAPCEYQCVVP